MPDNLPEHFGTKEVPPTICALSGRALEPGDITVKVKGTPYFYGVKASLKRFLDDDRRADIESAVKGRRAAVKTADKQEDKANG